ncbi:MAG TPA: hypothetical protein VNV43_03440, partial [Candidatus Acidoferrales bacterium]|nr:hypothetical protein [Candidatus Acidoferrales bacterium]
MDVTYLYNIPFQISFAGYSTNGEVTGGCGFGNGLSVSGTVDLNSLKGYTYYANGEGIDFCILTLTLTPPSCYDAYVNGVKSTIFGYSEYDTGGSFFAPTFSIRPNTNSEPIAEWDGCGNSTDGHYQLTPDGMSQAIGTVINTTSPVTFAFFGDSLGCTLTNTDFGAILTASTNYGTVEVVAETTNDDECLVTNFFFDLGECSSCSSGTCPSQAQNNSVDIRINLGPSALGGNAFLEAESQVPDPALGTPASLKCNFSRADLIVITNSLGWLQQVIASDRIINITTN